MPSYLLDVCDFNISYQGCSNKADMALVDLVFIVLHSISTLMYIVHLVMRFWSGKLSRRLSNMEVVAVLCVLLNLVRVLFRVSTRLSGLVSFESDDAVIANVRFSLCLEHFYSLFGSLALKSVMLAMVEAVSSASLIVPVTILGREMDPSTTLKIIRVVAMVVFLLWYSLWAFWAVNFEGDINRYILMRRLAYITWASLSAFISAPVNYYFGTKLITTLETSRSRKSDNLMMTTMDQSTTDATHSQHPTVHVDLAKNDNKDMMLLKFAFWGGLIIYIWIAIYFPSYVIFNETLQAYPNGLLIVKILIDSSLWVASTFILYFMFYKD